MRLQKLAFLLVVLWSSVANAGVLVYDFTFSGVSFGNSGLVVGQLQVDDTLVTFPGINYLVPGPGASLTMTMTGVAVGNGSYTQNDFGAIFWEAPFLLDDSQDWVGQTDGISGTWGVDPIGDFSLNALNIPAPTTFNPYTLMAVSGEQMRLTSFKAVSSVPEPSSMFALGVAGVVCSVSLYRRSRSKGQPAVI